MLDKGMDVWVCMSDTSYDDARAKVAKEVIALDKDQKLMLDKIASFGVELADIPKTKKSRKELVTKLMES